MKKLWFFSLFFFVFACTRTEIPFGNTEDCDPDITFSEDIVSIVSNSCAYSGCHINNTAPGNYDTYAGLLSVLDNGEFLKRVISLKDMPPSYAPDDKPQELTMEELELIACWAENDYPE